MANTILKSNQTIQFGLDFCLGCLLANFRQHQVKYKKLGHIYINDFIFI